MSPGDPSSTPQRPKNRSAKGGGLQPQWQIFLWYIPLLLFLLWLWFETATSMTLKTITYDEFKRYLAKGEVAECDVRQDEITGRIVPRLEAPPSTTDKAPHQAASSASTRKSAEAAIAQKNQASEKIAPKESGAEKAPEMKKGPQSKAAGAAAEEPFLFRTVRIEDPQLVAQLEAAHVKFKGVQPGFLSTFLVAWLIPIIFVGVIWYFLSRRAGGMGQAVTSIGKSKARLVAETDASATFADVAGCDEAKYELQEVVDFLKNPARYKALGATIPKGILLVGPPGTGKTLMARAIAGEAHVPFYSISGSEFVEMFVGVGAARVRDLFEQAKGHAPCIIFIDEIDAIGSQRTVRVGFGNDEREQTLNQLLADMDGFEPNVGVIILAATNRPDVLDRALLRPGRFDRQVVVDAPDVDGREAILKVHSRNKRLAEDADLRKIAQATVGFSGADLANALNEAALLAARRNETSVTQKDLEDAVEKVVAGPERKSRRLDPELKRRVAYHEVGHALVAAYSKSADPVHKISVVPRGRAALGYTLQLPTGEQFLMTRSELVDRMKGMLGGRSAEELVFGEVSTGAENDLHHATALARQMVCLFGMGDAVGLMHCGPLQDGYIPHVPGFGTQLDCSAETAYKVDVEVRKLLDEAHAEALAILKEHHDQLDVVAQELVKRETLDGETFNRLIGKCPAPERHAPAADRRCCCADSMTSADTSP